MNYIEKVKYIGSHGVLRVEMWRDGSKAWRGGVNWYSESDYDFVCEKPTFEGVIDLILAHKKEWMKPAQKKKKQIPLAP